MGHHGFHGESAEDIGDGEDVECGDVETLTHLIGGHLTVGQTLVEILIICY